MLKAGILSAIACFRQLSSDWHMILRLRLGGALTMFAIAFSEIVILALVSIVVHWTMRVRLMRLDSTKDRIEWLSFHGGDDVLNTYEALFPRSVLPRFCRFVFWTAIAVGLCAVVILKLSAR